METARKVVNYIKDAFGHTTRYSDTSIRGVLYSQGTEIAE